MASAFAFDKTKKTVVLLNHLDVVPANEEGWKYQPFEGTILNDTLYGRGVLDMKGLAIMQLYALKSLRAKADSTVLKYNFVMLCVSGEESGGHNGAALITEPAMLRVLNPLVVFGEGGGGLTHVVPGKPEELCFFVSNAEKKSLWIKLEARVKSRGHGSAAGEKTANKILLRAINKIENTERRIIIDHSAKRSFRELGKIMGGTRGFVLKHFDWWVFKPFRKQIVKSNEALKVLVSNSYELTRLDNPKGPVNQVSQLAAAYYDCRLLPHRSEKPFFMKLLFRIIDPRIRITVLDESPTAEASIADENFDKASAAIQSVFPKAHVIPVLFPATTDNSYIRSVNIPAFGFLPFELNESMMESVHAANEKIPLKALDQGIHVYETLLLNYIQNTPRK